MYSTAVVVIKYSISRTVTNDLISYLFVVLFSVLHVVHSVCTLCDFEFRMDLDLNLNLELDLI